MASKSHDLIVELLKIKIKQEGYEIVAFDSAYYTNLVKKRIPPKIGRHRPDIVGYNKLKDTVILGEAKYTSDLTFERTKQQIKDFCTVASNKKDVYVMFGVPISKEVLFLDILKKIGFSINEKIEILRIPDNYLIRDGEIE